MNGKNMKNFRVESYFIATDSNHVSEHRRFVTPWFYVRMKSVHYVKVSRLPQFFFGMVLYYSGWTVDTDKYIPDETKQKLNQLTSIFNTSIKP